MKQDLAISTIPLAENLSELTKILVMAIDESFIKNPNLKLMDVIFKKLKELCGGFADVNALQKAIEGIQDKPPFLDFFFFPYTHDSSVALKLSNDEKNLEFFKEVLSKTENTSFIRDLIFTLAEEEGFSKAALERYNVLPE